MSLLSTALQFAYSDGYTYYEGSRSMTNDEAALTAGMFALVMLFTFVMVAVCYVVVALLMARIFKKAGVESWKAWVPFYNHWTLLELGGQKGFWAVLAIIPIVNIASAVFMYIAMYNIGLKLGKGGEFVLWAIFVPLVWFIWLAVDDSKWSGKKTSTVKKAA